MEELPRGHLELGKAPVVPFGILRAVVLRATQTDDQRIPPFSANRRGEELILEPLERIRSRFLIRRVRDRQYGARLPGVCRDQLVQLGHQLRLPQAVIERFAGVFGQVIQFMAGFLVRPVAVEADQLPALRNHAGGGRPAPDGPVPIIRQVRENRAFRHGLARHGRGNTAAIHWRQVVKTAHLGEGGQHVPAIDGQIAAGASPGDARPDHETRNPHASFVDVALAAAQRRIVRNGHTPFRQHGVPHGVDAGAIVREKHNDGFFRHSCGFDGLPDLADRIIGVLDHRGVDRVARDA